MNVVIENIEFEQIQVGHDGETLNGACYINFKCWNDGVQISGRATVDSEGYHKAVAELKEHLKEAIIKAMK